MPFKFRRNVKNSETRCKDIKMEIFAGINLFLMLFVSLAFAGIEFCDLRPYSKMMKKRHLTTPYLRELHFAIFLTSKNSTRIFLQFN